MIPTIAATPTRLYFTKFQSRNRETYDSNLTISSEGFIMAMFQSRNRETYDSNTQRNYEKACD